MYPLYQQATFILGDQLPKCSRLDSSGVRQLLDDFDLLLSRLPSGQQRPSLFQTLTPPQWNQILWAEIAASLKAQTSSAAALANSSSSDDEDGEEATVPVRGPQDMGELKQDAVGSDLSASASTSLDSLDVLRTSITDRLSQDVELRRFLIFKYGPANKTAALACLRAVVMDPHADHFSSADLASCYVAKFESALRWCGTHSPSRKKINAVFISGVQTQINSTFSFQ